MNNTINTDDNDSNNINIPKNESTNNTIDNNSTSRANSTIYNLSRKRKLPNACGDELIPKQAKVTNSHIIAKSIVAVAKEMQAGREEK